MIKNKINHSAPFLRKTIFLLIQILFFVECGRLDQGIQKEAALLKAKHTLDRKFEGDKFGKAKALGLPYGDKALIKSLMKLLNCTEEELNEIFPTEGTINKQKLKEHRFQARLIMESFCNQFPTIMDKLDKTKFTEVDQLCTIVNNSKSGSVPEGSSLLKSFTDALLTIFTRTDKTNYKENFQGATFMDQDGNIDSILTNEEEKYKSVDLKSANYDPGTIGNVLAKYSLTDEPSYPGQILKVMEASITTIISNIISKITDNEIEIGGKKYTKMNLQSLLNKEANKIIKEKSTRIYKDRYGKDVEEKVYKTVSEILKEVMKKTEL